MNIANILARKGSMAVTVRPEQSIRDALALLDRHNIGALVAVEGDRPVGILSERDIVREAVRNERFFDLAVSAIEEVTGRKPDLSTSGGTSDARFISSYCPVIEFGLVGQTMHQVDERTPVSDLEKLTKVYRGVLERYFA